MWIRTVILDESVERPYHLVFAGFNKDTGLGEWVTKPEHAKLYESEEEAIADAKKLSTELPVSAHTYSINPSNRRVSIKHINFES